MYRPVGDDSIWIPIGLLVWGFRAVADSSDNGLNWEHTEKAALPYPEPRGFQTIDFPVWHCKVDNNNPYFVQVQ